MNLFIAINYVEAMGPAWMVIHKDHILYSMKNPALGAPGTYTKAVYINTEEYYTDD